MQITMTREALIARLKDRLKLATAEDAEVAKKHAAEEQAALKAWRAKLREALKYPYARAKTVGPYCGESLDFKAPECPLRKAVPIQVVLQMIELSTSKTIAIKDDSDIGKAINWTPAAERLSRSVCGE